MSGAAALSAAKRRRGASAGQPIPTPGNRGGRGPPPRPQQIPPRPPAPTPMMLLQNHHERLASLETGNASMVDQLKNLSSNVEASTDDKSSSETDNKLMKLQAKVDFLEEQLNKKPEDDEPEDIQYFKDKVSVMELQMAELKQHLLKIQNFAMETNLSLMKAKQADNSIDDTEGSTSEAADEEYEKEVEETEED
jgi:hypothetical protein